MFGRWWFRFWRSSLAERRLGHHALNRLCTLAQRRPRNPDMSTISPDREHWSRFAQEWIAWARTPGHDAFWAYRRYLAEFIGPGDGEVLDVGCGEGRVSREL